MAWAVYVQECPNPEHQDVVIHNSRFDQGQKTLSYYTDLPSRISPFLSDAIYSMRIRDTWGGAIRLIWSVVPESRRSSWTARAAMGQQREDDRVGR